jgi:hypothetical protein
MAMEKSACAGGGVVTVIANGAVCVRVPEVPVIVAVEEPAAVPRGAVRVSVAAVPGVSVRVEGWSVTPAGKPVIVTGTFDENPFCAVASKETAAGVPFAVRVTAVGVVLSEKSAVGAVAACTESEAWVLAVWPFTVVVKVTLALAAGAEEAAVISRDTAEPGVSDSVDGAMVTPLGSVETVTVAAPAPAGAANSSEAC